MNAPDQSPVDESQIVNENDNSHLVDVSVARIYPTTSLLSSHTRKEDNRRAIALVDSTRQGNDYIQRSEQIAMYRAVI